MKKYKLINTETKEETLCDKVIIDGFDYYFLLEKYKGTRSYFYDKTHNLIMNNVFSRSSDGNIFDIVACNNPNIDIPKVLDEVNKWLEIGINEEENEANSNKEYNSQSFFNGVKLGYNKSQETHPFSEEDVYDIMDFIARTPETKGMFKGDILKLWKEQQPKIVYYVD